MRAYHVLTLALALAACQPADDTNTDAAAGSAATAAAPVDSLTIEGFQTPESVLYDAAADIYLVSNINGDPFAKDDNGFISRVSPNGTVDALKWIDGGTDAVTLNAPKGLAIIGDTLFVADIDSVRAFSRTSGAAIGARGVAGASFLNDLAASDDGVLYVSDTGVKAGFAPAGTDAVYRFDGNKAVVVAKTADLHAPNGLAITSDGILLAGFGGKDIVRIPTGGGAAVKTVTLPGGQLDGLVRLADGTLLVSSWETKSVYRVDPAGAVQTIIENVDAPADLGYDTKRGRLLIPLFNQNRVEVRKR